MRKEKNKPIAEKRLGNVKAAIWKNESTEGKTYHSVAFEKLYKTEDGWKTSTSFDRDDLPRLVQVAEDAYRWFYQQRETEKS